MSLKRNKSEENLRNTLFSSPLISARKQDCEGVRREQFESACFVDFYTRRQYHKIYSLKFDEILQKYRTSVNESLKIIKS